MSSREKDELLEAELLLARARASEVVVHLSRQAPAIRQEFLERVGDYLLASSARIPALARALQLYAVKKSELPLEEGLKVQRKDGGSWTRVQKEMCSLRMALTRPELKGIPPEQLHTYAKSDSLRNFLLGNSDTARDGRQAYCMLALLLIDVYLRYPDLKNHARIAIEDRILIQQLLNLWTWLKSDPTPGTSPLPQIITPSVQDAMLPVLGDGEVMRQYMEQIANYPPDRLAAFDSYYRSVAFGDKAYAHFVCYRPQLTLPHQFIKSFLVIVPRGQTLHKSGLTQSYTFRHFYQIDPQTAHIRRTLGIVLPLSGGLYLIGLQQIVGPDDALRRRPFNTLKVVAIPWTPVTQARTVIPGLVLSTNNEERQIISRLAIRPTMKTHHSDIGMGHLNIADLQKDIGALNKWEQSVSPLSGAFKKPDHPNFQVRQILQATNNMPTMDVVGFKTRGSDKVVRIGEIEICLNNALEQMAAFNDCDEPLQWEGLRFGALDAVQQT